MHYSFNYTQIIEKDGHSFLFDPHFVNIRKGTLDTLQNTLPQIRDCLEQFNYPTGEVWLRSIAEGGADGFCSLMVSENDREARRMKVPQFIASQWGKSLVEDTPKELIEKADAIRSEVLQASEELPLKSEDIVFKDGNLVVDTDAVTERIKDQAMLQITDSMKAEADAIKDMVIKARTLQDGGIHLIDVLKRLMGNWLAPSKFPDLNDDILVYKTLNSYRHNSRETIKAQTPEWYYLNGGE
ncbi:MAG: hypothetical protein IK145_07330 [Bacteroidales bacterium]|nr:hypothetical protein [Bacteroidales bacterium]